jgi:hypothetical protein
LFFGILNRPTDHVDAAALEFGLLVRIATDFDRQKSGSPQGMSADFFKETPEVEVLDAAIMMYVMTGSTLA